MEFGKRNPSRQISTRALTDRVSTSNNIRDIFIDNKDPFMVKISGLSSILPAIANRLNTQSQGRPGRNPKDFDQDFANMNIDEIEMRNTISRPTKLLSKPYINRNNTPFCILLIIFSKKKVIKDQKNNKFKEESYRSNVATSEFEKAFGCGIMGILN